ncbi:MAG: DUF4230 domain-containing protein [Leptolyngbya sp. PLA3]|nr:MAG: DUF4230 domain-containing protein [Cyanobacteria bacterium CYA]MCE7969638.1 DUF4230 domain-containing protein [Leptolyngbya sp. PL-A3]
MELSTIFLGLFLLGAFTAGLLLAWALLRVLTRRTTREVIEVRTIAEKVSAVGRLVGLEVCAKEIATAKSGWAWCPPVLLSQAKIAMIFHFEKQYGVDLSTVRPGDVRQLSNGGYRVNLPGIQGSLRLVDVQPYDIQQGRMLGLLDVIPMNADRQSQLMKTAQVEASRLFETHEQRYAAQARDAIERQLTSLLGLFGLDVEWDWADLARERADAEVEPKPALTLAG